MPDHLHHIAEHELLGACIDPRIEQGVVSGTWSVSQPVSGGISWCMVRIDVVEARRLDTNEPPFEDAWRPARRSAGSVPLSGDFAA